MDKDFTRLDDGAADSAGLLPERIWDIAEGSSVRLAGHAAAPAPLASGKGGGKDYYSDGSSGKAAKPWENGSGHQAGYGAAGNVQAVGIRGVRRGLSNLPTGLNGRAAGEALGHFCGRQSDESVGELLGSEQMRMTLDVWSGRFDSVLLALPPVNAVSDPRMVFMLDNGMVVVVRQLLEA